MNKKIIIIVVTLFVVILGYKLVTKKAPRPIEAQTSAVDVNARRLYVQAGELKKDRKFLEAKEAYQRILKDYPEAQNIDAVQKELEDLNLNMIISNFPIPDKTEMHEVAIGDTLGKIARKYGTTVELIKRCNNLKSDIIRVGQKLRIYKGDFNIYVDKSQNILILKDGNDVVKVYHVSTGENNSTPVGTFTVTTKLVDPVWFNRGAVVPPESPENVLGTRWLGFDLPGYGIHGTVDPDSIGQQVTAGCIRMVNKEVEELYGILPLGTEVVIVD